MKTVEFVIAPGATREQPFFLCRLALCIFAFFIFNLSSAALAQVDSSVPTPPELKITSPADVDMHTGNYAPESTDLSIGSAENGGISIVRIPTGNPVPDGQPLHPKPAFITNWDFTISVRGSVSSGKYYTIENKLVGKTFYSVIPAGPYYAKGYNPGGEPKLERLASGSNYYYRFTAIDGTVLEFGPSLDGLNTGASKLSYTNGVTYTFAYDNGGLNGDPRVRRISSNTGYVAVYEYQAASNNGSVTKICVFNAATITPPTAQTCPAGARSVSYTYNGKLLSTITDSLANVSTITSTYVNSTTPYQESFYKPGLAQPWLTNSYALEDLGIKLSVATQQFADGHTYSYNDFGFKQDDWPKAAFWGRGWTENGTASTMLGWAYYQQTPTSARIVTPGPVSVADPGGNTTYTTFDTWYATLDLRTLPSGIQSNYDFNGNQSLTKITTSPATGFSDPAQVTQYSYDCTVPINCGKIATKTDPRGNVTNYTYDPVHGGVLTETKPAAPSGVRPQTRYTYGQFYAWYRNSSGTLVQASTPVWRVTQISECHTQASCAGTSDETRTTFVYGTSGVANNLLVTQKTVAAGDGSASLVTAYTYDSEGNKLTEDGPMAGTADTTRWRYDSLRRVVGTVTPDPDGAGTLKPLATRTTFDAAGRATKVELGTVNSQSDADWATFAAYRATLTDYDLLDRKAKEQVKGSDGVVVSVTQYSYDSFGRPECTAERMNPAVFASLPASACTLGTEGSNGPDRITKNLYDAAGQLLQVRKGVGTPLEQAYATYTYTPDGKREYLVDANGNKAKFEYDGFDRQAKWIFPSPTLQPSFDPSTPTTAMNTAGAINAADYEQYAYDNNGNRTSFRKRDGSTLAYAYDNLDRMTVKTVPARSGLAATHTRNVYYDYDLQGHETKARFDSLAGEGETTAYDPFGQVRSVSETMDSQTRAFEYLYDNHGNRTRITWPDGVYLTYGFDGLDRPSLIQNQTLSNLVQPTYDSQGMLASLTRSSSAADQSFTYDPVGRLATSVIQNAQSGVGVTWSFTRNPAGQILTDARDNDAYAWNGQVNVDRSYAANGLNQYTAAGPASFCYDANGNLTADGSSVYLYDVENRLVEKRAQTNSTCGSLSYAGTLQASLRYDPLGRLHEVTSSAGVTTRFVYDGDALVGEYNTAGTLLRRYAHGADAGADDPLMWFEGTSTAFANARHLYADPRGSIVLVGDSAGAATAKNTYDEYGIPGAANQGRFQYTGQAWLPEIGMYYYKARIYSPTLGRFLQTDPIGYEDQVNLYGYVGNDPVNGTDPTGLEEEEYRLSLGGLSIAVSDRGISASASGGGGDVRISISDSGIAASASGGGGRVAASISDSGIAASASGGGLKVGASVGDKGISGQVTYQTYTKTNPTTGEVYTGRTSGTGTPAQNVARRDSGHHANERGFGPARLDRSSTNPQAIRGREQQMIERNGGAQSQGGTSGNRINGISDRNPQGGACRAAANEEFGSC